MLQSTPTEFLQQVPIFAGLEKAVLAELAAHIKQRRFGANETLFHEGDSGHTLYVVLVGRVRIQRATASGGFVHIANLGPGQQFGEMSLIDGEPRMADAVTVEPSTLLMLDREDFLQCIDRSPIAARAVMTSLVVRLRRWAVDWECYRDLDVLGRVSSAILDLLPDDRPAPRGACPEVKITQSMLGAQIGTTRESVSRAITSLKAVGAIRSRGRTIVVVDPERLRQYCGRSDERL